MLVKDKSRRGLSSVLTSIILTGIMIIIGLGIWGYAQSASSAMSSDYFDEVMESVYTIKERFRVENVAINITSPPSVRVYIQNYGSYMVNISKVHISARGNSTTYYPSSGGAISPDELIYFDIEAGDVPINKGMSLAIRLESTRGNKVYESIWIP